jgi:hypothetical protein
MVIAHYPREAAVIDDIVARLEDTSAILIGEGQRAFDLSLKACRLAVRSPRLSEQFFRRRL